MTDERENISAYVTCSIQVCSIPAVEPVDSAYTKMIRHVHI